MRRQRIFAASPVLQHEVADYHEAGGYETTARHMLSAVSSDVTPVKDGSDRISFARMESAMLMTDKATIARRRKTILMSNLEMRRILRMQRCCTGLFWWDQTTAGCERDQGEMKENTSRKKQRVSLSLMSINLEIS